MDEWCTKCAGCSDRREETVQEHVVGALPSSLVAHNGYTHELLYTTNTYPVDGKQVQGNHNLVPAESNLSVIPPKLIGAKGITRNHHRTPRLGRVRSRAHNQGQTAVCDAGLGFGVLVKQNV